jgi:hypothetical protein
MSNTTYSAAAFKPVASNAPTSLLRELFEATPLYIFATALQAAFAKTVQR